MSRTTTDGRNFFGWVAPVWVAAKFAPFDAASGELGVGNHPLTRKPVKAIRAASPTLFHADHGSFTVLMPGSFNKRWLAREVKRGGRIVHP